MSVKFMRRDARRTCPDCNSAQLDYVDIPSSTRTYTEEDGEKYTEFFGPARDYQCRNCECEFTLTEWED